MKILTCVGIWLPLPRIEWCWVPIWRKGRGRRRRRRRRKGIAEEVKKKGKGKEETKATPQGPFSLSFSAPQTMFLNIEKSEGTYLTPRVTWAHSMPFWNFALFIPYTQTYKEGDPTLKKAFFPRGQSCQPWATQALLQPSHPHSSPLPTCHMTWCPGLCSVATFSWSRVYPAWQSVLRAPGGSGRVWNRAEQSPSLYWMLCLY